MVFVIALIAIQYLANCSHASSATASDEPVAAASEAVQDIILLSPTHPVRIRLHIQVNGVPFREARRSAVEATFDRLDVKKSGKLSEPQANQLFALFGARPSMPPGKTALAKVGEMMMGASREFTRQEIHANIVQNVPQFTIETRLASGGAGPALFTLLDKDGDGRLSLAELNSAEQSLRCRDFNDDGLLTPEELLQGPARGADEQSLGAAQNVGAVISVDANTPVDKLVETLLFRYDRDRDGRLTIAGPPVEVRSPGDQLSPFDRNADRLLDRAELAAWLHSESDLQLNFQFGPRAAAARATRVAESAGATLYRVRPKLDGGYRLTIAENDLDFRRNNRDPAQSSQQQLPRFSDYDLDNNGELSAEEIKNANLTGKLAELGIDASEKSAEKLTPQKFDELMGRQAAATSSRLTLEVSEEGQDLFTLLDKNGDGFLTAREIKSASEILKTDDANRDGYLSGDEITYHMRLELARNSSNAQVAASRPRAPRVRPVEAESGGPEWFTKMDRNGDSQISPAELLGSQAQFDRLDSNHDGLLDSAEAAAASNRFQK